MLETPRRLGSDPRRHSLSLLSVSSKVSERQLMSQEEEEDDSSSSKPRTVLRKDMPICWLDLAQNIKESIYFSLELLLGHQ